MTEPGIVLFDGVCNLCNAAVNFIIDRDRRARFRFAALQSEAALAALGRVGRKAPAGDPDSLVLIEAGRLYERSDAVLRIARRLGFPWRLAWGLVVLPRSWRDAVYRHVARNRYRWFGRREVCRVPTPDLAERFL